MHVLFVSLLATIPLGTLVGAHRTVSRSRHRHVARQSSNNTYALQDFYQAEDFFKCVSILHVPCHAGISSSLANGHSSPVQTLRTAT